MVPSMGPSACSSLSPPARYERAGLGWAACALVGNPQPTPLPPLQDVDFFRHLELYLRQEATSLCGRDHVSYRGAFQPVRHVIDGDMCESFTKLKPEVQRKLAAELDRPVTEIIKKLEELRNRVL